VPNLLQIQALSLSFGGLHAVRDVTLDVRSDEILGLIGPNGAGKTSLINCLSGLYRPTSGHIRFAGHDLAGQDAWRIRRLGVARTFQNISLISELSVLDNVLVGGHSAGAAGYWASVFTWTDRKERALRADAIALCERLGLADCLNELPSELPYGTQKRIELARALLHRPDLLLADEPAAGLSHGEVNEFGELLRELRREMGLTLILVEHHMGLINAICDRVAVMVSGRLVALGTPETIRNDAAVRAAYLGGAGEMA